MKMIYHDKSISLKLQYYMHLSGVEVISEIRAITRRLSARSMHVNASCKYL